MNKKSKRIIERFIGQTDKEDVNHIKMSPFPKEMTGEEKEALEKVINKKRKPNIIFNTNELSDNEKQLFKILLINNNIDETFTGKLEIYEI